MNSKVLKTKNGRTMLSSKCALCSSKKSRFMKEQEAKGTLSSSGLKHHCIRFHYWVTFSFKCNSIE